MKKILVMALVFIMGCAGFAEEELSTLADYAVAPGEEIVLDLDGDGAEEKLAWNVEYDEENYTETVTLSVIGAGSGVDHVVRLYMANVYVMDVDGDGVSGIFVSGDLMSSDYVTYCLRYADGKLVPALFEDANRGENTDGLFDYGYGLMMDAVGGKVELSGAQDILGTYFGSRTYELRDGVFCLTDDGLWVFERDYMDEESWDYAGIVPNQDIPVTFVAEDGTESAGVIAAGERLMVTASDKVSVVHFAMEDGRTGYFAVEPDAEMGWGVKVNGVNENELFDMLPYAG